MPIFDSPAANRSEFRFAIRGTSRSEKDHYAASILASILDRRFKQADGEKAFVRYQPGILPGSFLFGVSDWYLGKLKRDGDKMALPETDGYAKRLMSAPVKQDEFDTAKRELAIAIDQTPPADIWLDIDTYKLPAPGTANAETVSLADVQRVLERLQKEPVAQVLVFSNAAAATTN